ncbi:MAG: xylulokinase [Aggregatilineales bacterium]
MNLFSIGLDVGTSSLKGLLVDERGTVSATAEQTYPLHIPRPGWSEQDPQDWWTAAQIVSRRLVAALPPGGRIAGVGLSGQMHGSVFMDAAEQVLYPAILWNDQRTDTECSLIEELTGGQVTEWTLNPPRTAFTATKILWFRRHHAALYDRVAHILLPKDYIRHQLTGEFATEVTDASGTNLLDVRRRRWSTPMLAALDVPVAWLGDVVESQSMTGSVTAQAAYLTGIPAGTPVIGGSADQAAAAIGSGVSRQGITSLTIGTSGVVYAQLGDDVIVDPTGAFHTFCHSVPNTWMMMAGVLSAGGSLRWYRDVVGEPKWLTITQQSQDAYDRISAGAAEVPPGAEGLIFLPYLTGERAPHTDPKARGAWVGLTARHDRRHLARAVMEGVAFALRDLVEQLRHLNVPIHELRVAGGGAKGKLWMSILASILNRPLQICTTPDSSAYGASMLGMAHALGENVAVLSAEWVRTSGEVLPDPIAAAQYDQYYPIFRMLYPATKPAVHRLADLADKYQSSS